MPLTLKRQAAQEGASYRLVQKIVALSESNKWEAAKQEWCLEEIYFTDEPGTCICGHYPIIEHCIIRNRENGNTTTVGNMCVKRFLGLPSDKLFGAISRIAEDHERPLNAEMIEHAHRKGWINDWEYSFYSDTLRKRKLSPRQRTKRVEINRNILERVGVGT